MHWHVKKVIVFICVLLCIGCGSNDVTDIQVESVASSAQSEMSSSGVIHTFMDTLNAFTALHDTVIALDSLISAVGALDSLVEVREEFATRLVTEVDAFLQLQDSLKIVGQTELDYQINTGGPAFDQGVAQMIIIKADEKIGKLSWLNEVVHADGFIEKYGAITIPPISEETTQPEPGLSSALLLSSLESTQLSSSIDLSSSSVDSTPIEDSIVGDSMVNNAPQFTNAAEAFISVKPGSEIIIDMLGSDLDGDSIWGVAVEGNMPSQGTLVFDDGIGVFTPHIGFRGEEAFSVALNDGNGGIAEKNIVVLILPDHIPQNNAIVFDGLDDRVSLPLTSIDFSTGVTINLWVKWPDVKDSGTIFELVTIDSTHVGLYSEGSSNKQVRLEINNLNTSNELISNIDAVRYGEWTHLSVIFNGGGGAAIYCNGQLWGFKDLIVPRGGEIRSFSIGGSVIYSDQFFSGSIDEVTMWNSILSQESIAQSQFDTVSEAPLLYVPFEESEPLISVNEKISDTYGTLVNMEGTEWTTSFTGPETLTVSATEYGSVDNAGLYQVVHGQEKTFIAVPNDDDFFDQWVVVKGSLVLPDSSEPEITVSVSEATHIEARFIDFITDTVTIEFEENIDEQANRGNLTVATESGVTYVRPSNQWYTFYWSNVPLLVGEYKVVCRASLGSDSDVLLRYAYDDKWTPDFKKTGLYKSSTEFQEFDIGSISVKKEGSASLQLTVGSLNLNLDWFKLVKME
ncbi:MAG: Ig-like domain-containing protein [Fibrobacterales bacterium]